MTDDRFKGSERLFPSLVPPADRQTEFLPLTQVKSALSNDESQKQTRRCLRLVTTRLLSVLPFVLLLFLNGNGNDDDYGYVYG